MKPVYISVKALYHDKDILSLLKVGYYADNKSFTKAFADIGILVDSEEDLDELAALHNKGGDINGDIKNPRTGAPIYFDTRRIAESVNIDDNELNNSPIKFVV